MELVAVLVKKERPEVPQGTNDMTYHNSDPNCTIITGISKNILGYCQARYIVNPMETKYVIQAVFLSSSIIPLSCEMGPIKQQELINRKMFPREYAMANLDTIPNSRPGRELSAMKSIRIPAPKAMANATILCGYDIP